MARHIAVKRRVTILPFFFSIEFAGFLLLTGPVISKEAVSGSSHKDRTWPNLVYSSPCDHGQNFPHHTHHTNQTLFFAPNNGARVRRAYLPGLVSMKNLCYRFPIEIPFIPYFILRVSSDLWKLSLHLRRLNTRDKVCFIQIKSRSLWFRVIITNWSLQIKLAAFSFVISLQSCTWLLKNSLRCWSYFHLERHRNETKSKTYLTLFE